MRGVFLFTRVDRVEDVMRHSVERHVENNLLPAISNVEVQELTLLLGIDVSEVLKNI